ncbi:unnamed protein product [Kuraishia capsulata CBS 1993]|uniref:Uncharacterized protein n=1 Tax=Kuraishia capsulata CBS 1993 TaxID=1382522 RepID=W6MT18_9ASCO|nr:uncharacterized protein KUCA_T00005868001 [Kuraishia capsulata CBS 1993]CDK29874.1 unnamed protein product [Kuraishia capsulata CBS 1993]
MKTKQKAPKLERIEGRLVKHGSARSFSYQEINRALYIRGDTPFTSAVKHVEKMLDKLSAKTGKRGVESFGNTKFITVIGMGKAIEKVLSLGVFLKAEKLYRVDVLTKSVGVLDEFRKETKSSRIINHETQTESLNTFSDTPERAGEHIVELADSSDDSGDDSEDDITMRKRNVSAVELRVWRKMV